jgi:hypothetical protein
MAFIGQFSLRNVGVRSYSTTIWSSRLRRWPESVELRGFHFAKKKVTKNKKETDVSRLKQKPQADFIRKIFRTCSGGQEQLYEIYRHFDRDRRYSLDVRESLCLGGSSDHSGSNGL